MVNQMKKSLFRRVHPTTTGRTENVEANVSRPAEPSGKLCLNSELTWDLVYLVVSFLAVTAYCIMKPLTRQGAGAEQVPDGIWTYGGINTLWVICFVMALVIGSGLAMFVRVFWKRRHCS